MGQFQFNNNANNPLNTNFAFSNAVLGVFPQYTETDRYRRPHNRQMVVRVVRPGHLAARRCG